MQNHKRSVLVIRINSREEVFYKRFKPQLLRSAFPEASLTFLATPQTETLEWLKQSTDFSQLLIFPPSDSTDKSFRAFFRFMHAQRFDATVVCYSSSKMEKYARHLCSVLICPGQKLLWSESKGLTYLYSPAGLHIFLRAILSLSCRTIERPFLKLAISTKKRILQVLNSLTSKPLNAKYPSSDRPWRILYICLDYVGDLVMNLPAVHALRSAFPNATVDVIVCPYTASILHKIPFINEVLIYNWRRSNDLDTKSATFFEKCKNIMQLRHKHYDIVIESPGNNSRRWLAFWSGAPCRVGLAPGAYEIPEEACLFLLTHRVTLPSHKHAVDNNLAMVEALGIRGNIQNQTFRFPIDPEDRAVVDKKLENLRIKSPFCIIHACSTEKKRMWLPEYFAEVAEYVIEHYAFSILFSGSPSDAAYNQQMLEMIKNKSVVANGAGIFELSELPALFEKANLLVTIDTGPMHIAAMSGTPIVALMLPRSSNIHYPFGQKDSVILSEDEANEDQLAKPILESITVATVCDAIDRKLQPQTRRLREDFNEILEAN